MDETIGKRIAQLRQEHGWTQQEIATRLALSRVAISHFEMDLTIPGERTITLLAGLFKLSPHDLVEGTTYPKAKAERLPENACCYTPQELDLALLENDLVWLRRMQKQPDYSRYARELWDRWAPRLEIWQQACVDEKEKNGLISAYHNLKNTCLR
jgi:transcriptional regulator with XRE-family HTH domain